MLNVKKILFLVLILAIFVTISACVKDVDLSRTDEIQFTPEIQTDLVLFDITEKSFISETTGLFNPIIRDTVRLEFLDDSYIQDDLVEVEFSFKYTNKFKQAFANRILFLSEQDRVEHIVSFQVEAGDPDLPVETEKIDLIQGEQINVIKRSIKMVVELEYLPNDEPFLGELSFESKGLFSFEF